MQWLEQSTICYNIHSSFQANDIVERSKRALSH